jgi:outer membrane protein
MKLVISGLVTLTFVAGVPALAQQKIGVVQVESAITGTKEGQSAASDLETRMAPKRKELEAKQVELRTIQEKLQKGGAVMAEAARAQLAREMDTKNKDYKRTLEDAQAEFQAEKDKILNDLGQKVMVVINKYSKDNGYSLVIDVSNPQTPVMFAADSIDITKEVIDLYDKNSGTAKPAVSAAPPTAAPAKKIPPAAGPASGK